MSESASAAAIAKGKKLFHLYRRGVGGERDNAGRLLLAHLKKYDLTLYDLDPSLPVSQELSALANWRESAALLAKLGGPEQDDALTQLVDADDLTEAEMQRLLEVVNLQTLGELRLSGWIYQHGGQVEQYRQSASQVTSSELLHYHGSLAERLKQATLQRHYQQTHPKRLIRSQDEIERAFVAGLVFALSGHAARSVPEGIEAHLNVEQLAKLRALLASYTAEAKRAALDAARQFGEKLV